jgi:hypothetical protein
VHTSILHIEVILDRNETWHLIEVNFRLGGGCIPDISNQSLGTDIPVLFLKQLDLPDKNLFDRYRPRYPVIGYDFLSSTGGFFNPLRDSFKGSKVEWSFSKGQQVSKFPTSGFYALGGVAIPTSHDKVREVLEELRLSESSFYELTRDYKKYDSPDPLALNSKASLFTVVKQPYFLTALLLLVAVVAGIVAKVSKEQNEFVGKALSATVSYHVLSGEFFVIREVVENFNPGMWFKEIVITDNEFRVLYSLSKSKEQGYKFFSKLDHSSFEKDFLIQSDGVVIGHVFINTSLRHLIVLIFALSSSLIIVATLLQYVIIRSGVFDRVSDVKNVLARSSDLLDSLSKDLVVIGQSESSVDLFRYRHWMSSINFSDLGLEALKDGLSRILDVVSTFRDQFNTKRTMTG